MDNLTHTAVGLFLSRAGLKNWTPLATPILILASNLPDMDIAYLAGGSLNYLHYHRHWTHALASIPLMALIAVAVVRLAGRRPVAWVKAWIAGMIAVAIHVLLDLTNIYGVRPLLPFSDRWLHLDWTNVIDLWIWAVCLLATLGPFIGRLVGSEISSGAVKDRHHGRGLAWFALTFLVLYNGGRSLLHGRALSVLDSRLYQDVQPIRVAAGPDGINPLRWFGLAETPDFWVAADVNLAGEFDPTRATILHKPAPDPALDVARATHTFQVFLGWSQFPLMRVTPLAEPENGKLVQAVDLRFGLTPGSGFTASVWLDGRLRVIKEEFEIRPRPR